MMYHYGPKESLKNTSKITANTHIFWDMLDESLQNQSYVLILDLNATQKSKKNTFCGGWVVTSNLIQYLGLGESKLCFRTGFLAQLAKQ